MCFVCGSMGAFHVLHTKPRADKGAYYPFLSHHELPKGSLPPTAEGAIQACQVCFSFLNQQWETFERTKTPAIKRLYWLKRSDDGQFTGAEMRIQGEYAAQVMGLQYQPGATFGGNYPGPGDYRSDRSMSTPVPSLISPAGSTVSSIDHHMGGGGGGGSRRASLELTTTPNGVLDLSMPSSKQSRQDEPVKNKHSSAASVAKQENEAANSSMVCFLCGIEQPSTSGRFIYAAKHTEGDAFFPFLRNIRPPAGAMPLTKQGLTRVCSGCRKSLARQWKSFELNKTTEEHRIYRVNEKPFGMFTQYDLTNSVQINSERAPSRQKATVDEVCYLCAHVHPREAMKMLYSQHTDGKHMHFSFIVSLQRPRNAKPIDNKGRVLTCRSCYGYLQQQWGAYEKDGVPHKHRHYNLRPLSSGQPPVSPATSATGNQNNNLQEPLNIQIISSSPGPPYGLTNQGLLAIAPPSHPAHPFIGGVPTKYSPAQVRVSHTPPKSCTPPVSSAITQASQTSIAQSPLHVSSAPSMPKSESTSGSMVVSLIKDAPLSVELPESAALPSKICFLCGFKTNHRTFVLNSYPGKEATAPTGFAGPFFPFLANRDPSEEADSMTDDGTVLTCRYCYHSLMYQWNEYEISHKPGDGNRWLRRYHIKKFTCYLCSRKALRNEVCSVRVEEFPFLKEHPKPFGALVIDNGEGVVMCISCDKTLAEQNEDYERMGLPKHMRKYNWTAETPPTPCGQEKDQVGADRSLSFNHQHAIALIPGNDFSACQLSLANKSGC